MLDGGAVVRSLEACGITHAVWIPDSHLGTWEHSLLASSAIRLVRPTREGEAIGIAAGLILGGARPDFEFLIEGKSCGLADSDR